MRFTTVRSSARPGFGTRVHVASRALAIGLCLALVGCGSPTAEQRQSVADAPAVLGVDGIQPLSARIDAAGASSNDVAEVADAGTASAHATRLNPPTTAERVDPAQYVNSLPYRWGDMAPAMEAFRVVALSRSWTAEAVEVWTPFVFDVIVKESAGCPNARGGDIFASGSCTDKLVHGSRPDSGFGQVTPVLYGPGGIVCQQAGLCSQHQIIETAWNSMVALVVTLEELGRFPWCDYEGASRLHLCDLVARSARPIP
ncbi:MAG: hypothetical protein AB7L17_20785 [Ilumatobacteraceae bacterium]